MRAMTLDKAIEHAEKKAAELERASPGCACANDHKQLAAWLKELKARRAKDRQKTGRVVQFG